MKLKSLLLLLLVVVLGLSLAGCSCFRQAVKGEAAPPPPPQAAVARPPSPPAPAPVLQDIYFDLNKADIRTDAAATLKKNVEWFKWNPNKKVRVEGNTDIRGTEKYNMGLGQRRADAAKASLIKLGIDGALLQTVSYGEMKPLCPEKDEACWAKERRVHFTPLD